MGDRREGYGSGKFSNDRATADYVADIGRVKPCPVE
jgi:hypothetical protein